MKDYEVKTAKSQSAIEMIITYSWALLIIALFVAVAFVIAFSKSPTYYLGSSCYIQPSLPCTEAIIIGYSTTHEITYYLVLNNQLSTPIEFSPSNSINLTTMNLGASGTGYALGPCNPLFASVGASIICQVVVGGSNEPPIGSRVNSNFRLNYYICSSTGASSCGGTLYTSTGYSLETLANSTVSLETVTLNENVLTGRIVLNGIPYINNTQLYLVSGTYTVYAQPPPGNYVFSTWAVANSVSIGNVLVQNSVLTVTGGNNGILTANFIP